MQHPCLSERSISGDYNLGFHHRLVLFRPRSPLYFFLLHMFSVALARSSGAYGSHVLVEALDLTEI